MDNFDSKDCQFVARDCEEELAIHCIFVKVVVKLYCKKKIALWVGEEIIGWNAVVGNSELLVVGAFVDDVVSEIVKTL